MANTGALFLTAFLLTQHLGPPWAAFFHKMCPALRKMKCFETTSPVSCEKAHRFMENRENFLKKLSFWYCNFVTEQVY